MKVQDLQEARIAHSQHNEIIAEFLIYGMEYMDPQEMFFNIVGAMDGDKGLENAVKFIQGWNIAVEFAKRYADHYSIEPISNQELDGWIEDVKSG